jgi:hypothetical protein
VLLLFLLWHQLMPQRLSQTLASAATWSQRVAVLMAQCHLYVAACPTHNSCLLLVRAWNFVLLAIHNQQVPPAVLPGTFLLSL